MNIFVNMIICEYFRFRIHSHSAICQLLVLIAYLLERVFFYDFDSLISNRNRLTDSLY